MRESDFKLLKVGDKVKDCFENIMTVLDKTSRVVTTEKGLFYIHNLLLLSKIDKDYLKFQKQQENKKVTKELTAGNLGPSAMENEEHPELTRLTVNNFYDEVAIIDEVLKDQATLDQTLTDDTLIKLDEDTYVGEPIIEDKIDPFIEAIQFKSLDAE